MQSWLRTSLLACSIALAAGLVVAPAARAAEPIDIRWEQLIPPPHQAAPSSLMAKILPRRPMSTRVNMSVAQESDLVFAYDSRRVKISGFILPFNNDQPPYKKLLLIPFSGACVQFPPPRNQAILIAYEKGIQLTDFVYPFAITGVMNVAPTETDIAKIGYRISAETIEPQE